MFKRLRLPYVSLIAFILLALSAVEPGAQTAGAARADLWVTNGVVLDARTSNGTLYVGGQFDHVGPHTGAFGVTGAATGALDAGWPKITGTPGGTWAEVAGVVKAVAPDGAGGWYIGGKFSRVGGVAVNNLAHIRADKTVDTGWNPNPTPSHDASTNDIKDIEVVGGVVYVCGEFTAIGGAPRKGLAALDASTGLATGWNPTPSGAVFEIEITGDRVYVGGALTAVGTTARSGLAAFDLSTGALLGWNPALTWNGLNIYGGAHAIKEAGGAVYVGGIFTHAGGSARNGLAAFDKATGAALAWNPNPFDESTVYIRALAVEGATLYVGGRFLEIAGQSRRHLAALDLSTGALLGWNPDPFVNEGESFDANGPFVSDLVVAPAAVYVAGAFKRLGGQPRLRVGAVDKVTGAATAWRADAGNVVNDLALAGETLAAGGDFQSVGGARRHNLAALDLATGRATDWDANVRPAPNGSVKLVRVAPGGATAFVHGNFTQVGGSTRNYLAEVNLSTGLVTNWNVTAPNDLAFGSLSDMVLTTTNVYLAGSFTVMRSTTQVRYLAALTRTSAVVTGFSPQPDFGVAALALDGSTLYVGGAFTEIAGQRRSRIAAFDLTTGALKDFKIDILGDHTAVSAIAVADGKIFFGGRFYEFSESPSTGAQPVIYQIGQLAAADAATGRLYTDWAPRPDFPVTEIEVSGVACYVAGSFRNIGWNQNTSAWDHARNGVAAVSTVTGEISEWDPRPHVVGGSVQPVHAVAPQGDTVYLGGNFIGVDGQARKYLAGVAAPTFANVSPAVSLSAAANGTTAAAPASVAVQAGTSVTLSAAPADVDGAVVRVDFYAGQTLLSGDTSAPFELTKSDFAAGEHQLRAVATDDRGGTGESALIRLTVLPANGGLKISGRVVDQDGVALAGVSVSLSGAATRVALTDALGRFAFDDLAPNAAYAVRPALDGYDLRPEGLQFPNLSGDEAADFIAYRQTSAGEYTSNLWVPNGAVRAAVVKGDTLYIGGDFTSLRGIGEHGATVSTVTAAVDQRAGRVNGKIYAAAPDGAGGWYVGGTFTLARGGDGQVERLNLAHLLADGSLDEGWSPSTDGKVNTLLVRNNTLYVGGQFTAVNGQTRRGLAALDKATGALSAWDAGLTMRANRTYLPVAVHALLVDGTRLFVGGQFDLAGGVDRAAVAQFDLAGASPALTTWTIDAGQHSGPVRALALAAETRTLYLGGLVFFPAYQQGRLFSAVDADTGALRTAFDPPRPGGDITSLAVYQNTLYVTGEFTGFYTNGGNSAVFRRGGLAAVDATTGALTNWHPQIGPSGQGAAAMVVRVAGPTLYVGGNFNEVGGTESQPATAATPRKGLAAYNAATGALNSWNPVTGGYVTAFALHNTTLFVGSSPTTAGLERKHLAAIDVNTGQPTNWNPSASARVVDLAPGDTSLYAAGEFDTVGGLPHKNVAEISLSTGAPTEWNPANHLDRLEHKATEIAVTGDRVFLGGSFASLSSAFTRPALVAVSRATGQPVNWDAGFAGGSLVRELVADGTTLYVGGHFTEVGGQTRAHLAALDATNAQLLNWNPSVGGAPAQEGDEGPAPRVEALALAGGQLYVGGRFDTVGAQPRHNLAELSLQTALPTAWNPDVISEVTGATAATSGGGAFVNALAVSGSLVYAGGHFDHIGALARTNLAAVSRNTGLATDWNPEVSGGDVRAVTASTFGGKIFVGGSFTSALGLGADRAHLVGVRNPDPLSQNAPPAVDLFIISGVMESGRAATRGVGAPRTNNDDADAAADSVDLSAEAFDADGAVSRVEFYRGQTLVAVDAARPFNARAENLPAGTHTFTARAFDNMGVPTTSDPVAVTVGGTPTPTPSPTPAGPVNVALAAQGAVATASSIYDARFPAAAVNDGDRKGLNWAAGGGWNDGTGNAYPDWVEVAFSGAKTIGEVDVFTVQDAFSSPAEPTETLTFSKYGATSLRVDYWDGSAWTTVPGGHSAAANRVWRKFTFAPVTTTKIRVVVTGALDGYSRLVEVEAWQGVPTPTPTPAPAGRVNVALSSNGATAAASSSHSPNHPAASVINGDRRGLSWGAGGGWNDATGNSYPDWLEVTFDGAKTIDEVDVFTLQDAFANPAEPTEAMTFTKYGVRSFDVQHWTGAAWAALPGAQVTGNDRAWRKLTFPAVTTNRIRVVVNGALDGYSRLVEVEAWQADANAPARTNHALAANGATVTASSSYGGNFAAAAVNNGDRKGLNWGAGGGWNDATGDAYPDWVEVAFGGAKTISEVSVFTVQDAYASPSEPTEMMTFTKYGVTAFDVQAWDGAAWATVPGGAVTGNDRVWRKVTFAPVTTTKLRVLVKGALGGYSRVAEVEAY